MTRNATNDVLMVRPARFEMNAQTAVDNFYQRSTESIEEAHTKALMEFDRFVTVLRENGVNVHVIQDSLEPHTPDSIFPNNWISMHEDGRVFLYPMKAENRRLERRPHILDELNAEGFLIEESVDFSPAELDGIYLEGTGAMIFDHDERLVYMARSQRADEGLLAIVAEELNYKPIVFSALQNTPEGRLPIYHTNVMMCVTDKVVIICLDTIDDIEERVEVVKSIESSGKTLIEITESQKEQFAGNMLCVKGNTEKTLLVMSARAEAALSKEQKSNLQEFHTIVSSDLQTIEDLGGGSARCMLAEIYLPKSSELE